MHRVDKISKGLFNMSQRKLSRACLSMATACMLTAAPLATTSVALAQTSSPTAQAGDIDYSKIRKTKLAKDDYSVELELLKEDGTPLPSEATLKGGKIQIKQTVKFSDSAPAGAWENFMVRLSESVDTPGKKMVIPKSDLPEDKYVALKDEKTGKVVAYWYRGDVILSEEGDP